MKTLILTVACCLMAIAQTQAKDFVRPESSNYIKGVEALNAAGKYIAIETNGTCVLPEDIDWVTCSPKEGTTLKLHHIDEVKVVYVGQDVSPYLKLPAKHHFLQPCSGQNTNDIIAYIKEHPQWRLSLQTHKLIDIP